jgi:hypothetical protein
MAAGRSTERDVRHVDYSKVSTLGFCFSSGVVYASPIHPHLALLEWPSWIGKWPPNDGEGCKGLDVILEAVEH